MDAFHKHPHRTVIIQYLTLTGVESPSIHLVNNILACSTEELRQKMFEYADDLWKRAFKTPCREKLHEDVHNIRALARRIH